MVSLERTSIYYQFLLFQNANIVIANHGASLSNIVFMNDDSRVIEVISKFKLHDEKEDSFKNLCDTCKVHHDFIVTEDEHDSVNINAIIKMVKRVTFP